MSLRPWKSGFETCDYCGGDGGQYGRGKQRRSIIECSDCNGTGRISVDGEQMDNDEWLENIEERLQALEEALEEKDKSCN